MSSDSVLKIHVDTDEAMRKLKELQEQAERTTESILRMNRELFPGEGKGNDV